MSLEPKIRKQFGANFKEDDIETLNIDGMIDTNKFSDNEKEYLERFEILSEFSACKLNLATVENLPAFSFLDTVISFLIPCS